MGNLPKDGRVRTWLNQLRRQVFTQTAGVQLPVEKRTFSQKSFSILSLTSSIVKAATEIAYNKCLHYYRWGLETEDIPVVCKRFLKIGTVEVGLVLFSSWL